MFYITHIPPFLPPLIAQHQQQQPGRKEGNPSSEILCKFREESEKGTKGERVCPLLLSSSPSLPLKGERGSNGERRESSVEEKRSQRPLTRRISGVVGGRPHQLGVRVRREEEKVGRQEGRKGTLTLAAAAAAKPVKKMQSCYATGVAVGRESTATGSH